MKNSLLYLTLLLLWIIVVTIGTFFFMEERHFFWGCICGGLVLGGVVLLYSLFIRNTQKIAFLFDSIENDDYTFRFIGEGDQYDKLLNNSLNRIKRVLENTRNDIIEHEKYYEHILNNVETGIIIADSVGNIYQTNQAALKLLGLPVFTHVQQLKNVDKELINIFKQTQNGDKRQISFCNERGTVTLSMRTSEVVIRQNRRLIIALNDINNELDERETESWIRLIRILTHEIMNAITPITSLSESLLTIQEPQNDNIYKGLEAIHTTGKGLISFVETYRELTRIPPPKQAVFEVQQFLTRMIRLSLPEMRTPIINLSIQPDDLLLYADENLISQVVLNLLKNALHASQNGEAILIKAYNNDEGQVMIEICDNGCGIPDEIVPHIFIPFFTTKESGSGIGLSIARQIMRLHGGTLSLIRNTTNFRTVFRLTFA